MVEVVVVKKKVVTYLLVFLLLVWVSFVFSLVIIVIAISVSLLLCPPAFLALLTHTDGLHRSSRMTSGGHKTAGFGSSSRPLNA